MGGKDTVIPLLKGKVQIPPPAGHFIDPLLLAPRIFSRDLGKNPQQIALKILLEQGESSAPCWVCFAVCFLAGKEWSWDMIRTFPMGVAPDVKQHR